MFISTGDLGADVNDLISLPKTWDSRGSMPRHHLPLQLLDIYLCTTSLIRLIDLQLQPNALVCKNFSTGLSRTSYIEHFQSIDHEFISIKSRIDERLPGVHIVLIAYLDGTI